jgi:hypothetical protein
LKRPYFTMIASSEHCYFYYIRGKCASKNSSKKGGGIS